jgi:hypothetical protein
MDVIHAPFDLSGIRVVTQLEESFERREVV